MARISINDLITSLAPSGRAGAIARQAVQVTENSSAYLSLDLACGPDLGNLPDSIDEAPGVRPYSNESNILVDALLIRARAEVLSRDDFGAWVRRQVQRYGGTRPFAQALINASPTPITGKDPLGAQMRAIQRWAKGQYQEPSATNRGRVDALRGPLIDQVGDLVRGLALTLGITGKWLISQQVQDYNTKHTKKLTYPSPAHDVLAGGGTVTGGSDFIGVVLDDLQSAIHQTPDLVRVYGLHLDVWIGG